MSRCAVGPQQPLAVEGNVHIAHEAKPGAKKLTGCYQKVSNKVINVWLLLSYLLWILFSETLKSKSGELGQNIKFMLTNLLKVTFSMTCKTDGANEETRV